MAKLHSMHHCWIYWSYLLWFFCCWVVWSCLRDVQHWQGFLVPIANLWGNWIGNKFRVPKKLSLFVFAGFAWPLWTNRNKMAIEHRLQNKPTDVNYIWYWYSAEMASSTEREQDKLKFFFSGMRPEVVAWLSIQDSVANIHRSDLMLMVVLVWSSIFCLDGFLWSLFTSCNLVRPVWCIKLILAFKSWDISRSEKKNLVTATFSSNVHVMIIN